MSKKRRTKTKGPDLRATRHYLNLMCRGYKDFQERSPGKREPDGEPLSDDVCAYWDGWNAATRDMMSTFCRRMQHERAGRAA